MTRALSSLCVMLGLCTCFTQPTGGPRSPVDIRLSAFRVLVASPPSQDLFIRAKHLFIAAMDGKSPDHKLAERIEEEPRSSALSALHHRVEPNASLSLCPRSETCSSAPKICLLKPSWSWRSRHLC